MRGINMSAPEVQSAILAAECERWLAEHPGRVAADYRKLLAAPGENEVVRWRKAKGLEAIKAEEAAWLRENPGEHPLPEHLCGLDHPLSGYERWAAKAKKWLEAREAIQVEHLRALVKRHKAANRR